MGRRKGTSAFPVARIKKMMQSDEEVGKIATVTPVLVAKALECMMEDVLREAADVARERHTRTVTPLHLKTCVARNDAFDFLRPIVRHVSGDEGKRARSPADRRAARAEAGSAAAAEPKKRRVAAADKPDTDDVVAPPAPPAPPAPDQHPQHHPVDDNYDEEDNYDEDEDDDAAQPQPQPPQSKERVSVHALLS
ncbi:unnamed protein product [Chondrus crispus]|uniref:Transcription factor CBF/NF-Y/archaeal histone domain-containing protein n=1 Tax=Chondrus crispus TaxID=2769 RepID=R7QK66_CHOCR|nr:unnamed protein product [Chondrus crispus]CDF38148.1 unnamed protein product [Chondrus crispus]|eukprot:XP_005718017.1 unnamed protein product [Chondrus crispus]